MTRVRILLADDHHIVRQGLRRVIEEQSEWEVVAEAGDVDLVKAVGEATHGRSFFSPAIARLMLADYRRQTADKHLTDRYQTLSEREREVLQLIAEAKTNKEIATLLNVSPSTVETHRAHILDKLDLHSAAEIVLYAVRRGIIR